MVPAARIPGVDVHATDALSHGEPTRPGAGTEKMLRARPLALHEVRLLGGPLKHAQELTARYLLQLEPDRMLAFYRIQAKLEPKAKGYTGWDDGGRNLTGHIAGHYLSAVSLMYRATGDARFKERADTVVAGLREVQDANGDGFAGALEGVREAFAAVSRGEIRSSGFDLNGLWSPWYTLHKTYAGLRDAYRHAGNTAALTTEVKFAEWAARVLAPMSDADVQRMLNTEHGGMNEVLVDLHADTGDRRWLDLSRRFEHHAFTDPLKRHEDNLSGKHGNCQIPKLIGSAARYSYLGETDDILAAAFFFDRVAQHHSYATGGHGLSEYFGAPDQLSKRVDGRAAETCNVYNMIKLARRLFSLRPDASYADFHERALFNHILASIDPEDGRTSYMVPVGRGVQQEYQDMQQDFTCCVGTGMESHALHGHGIYYESDSTLWVNLFVPSWAQFTTGGVQLTTATDFPDGDHATIALAMPAPKAFALAVRRPVWAGDGFTIAVNGVREVQPPLASLHNPSAGGRSGAPGNESVRQSSTYVTLQRTWKSGDTIEIGLPKSLRLEPTADDPRVAAIMWGPLVLAGDHGPRRDERRAEAGAQPVPALVAANRPLTDWVVAGARAGDFTARHVARMTTDPAAAPASVSLAPFYRTHRRSYSAYFDILSPSEFDARVATLAADRARNAKVEAATLAFVRVGEPESERSYHYQSDPANRPSQRNYGRASRAGTGWFSYDLPVKPDAAMALIVTYLNEPGLTPTTGDFDVIVDGSAVAHFVPDSAAIGFYDARYALPADLVRGKQTVTVRFQAAGAVRIPAVFAVRMINATDAGG